MKNNLCALLSICLEAAIHHGRSPLFIETNNETLTKPNVMKRKLKNAYVILPFGISNQ